MKKILSLALVLMTLISVLLFCSFSVAAATVTTGDYYIVNVATGDYLTVDSGYDANTQNVSVNGLDNNNKNAYIMHISPTNVGYKIRPLCSSSRLINPYGYSVTSGLNVNIYDDVNDSTQWWQFEQVSNGYIIRNVQNPNCVLTQSDKNAIVYDYSGWINQVWQLVPSCTHQYTNACDTSCNLCGATRSITHNYAAATCTAPQTCKVCGATTGSKLNHSQDNGTITKHPTCAVTGTKVYKCTRCSQTTATETLPKLTTHTFTNNCDTTCDVCGLTRQTTHIYDNSCDTACNVCGTTRSISHVYDNVCDTSCNVCGATRSVSHAYDNSCDTDCNLCGATRSIDHVYDNSCDTDCNVCGETREIWHTYDSTYDVDCNVCGEKRVVTGNTGDCAWKLDGSVLTISGCGAMKNYTKDSAAPWGTEIEQVIVEEGVESIGNRAFLGCSKLTSVKLPSTLTGIGNNAFASCTALEEIYLPNSLNSFGTYVFDGCSSLKSIRIPKNITTISDGLLANCTSLEKIYVPSGIKNINIYAFYSDNQLKEVYYFGTHPTCYVDSYNTPFTNATWINSCSDNHFYANGCDASCDFCNVTRTVPDHVYDNACDKNCNECGLVREVGEHVYDDDTDSQCNICSAERSFGKCGDCDWIRDGNKLSFANGTYLDEMELWEIGLYNIEEIVLGKGITSIPYMAFSDCKNLEKVTMYSNWEDEVYIGYSAFQGCAKLKEFIALDDEGYEAPIFGYIGDNAFESCSALEKFPSIWGGEIGWCAFYNCKNLKQIGAYYSKIGQSAFENCVNLEYIGITEANKIEADAFYNTAYYNNTANWENNVLYIGDALIKAKASKTGTYVIKDDIITIADNAFIYCGISDVHMPNTIRFIGDDAFSQCLKLTWVSIPVWCEQIGNYAFSGCEKLTKVTFSGSEVPELDWSSFISSPISYVYFNGTDKGNYYESDELYYATWKTCSHYYSNECTDTRCNGCQSIRTVYGCYYDNCADKYCNSCGAGRTASRCSFSDDSDRYCNICGFERTVEGHITYLQPISFANSSSYPFDYNDDIYSSTNKTHSTTSTFTIDALYDCTIDIEYYTSTEASYDKLIIKHNSTTKVTQSGSSSWQTCSLSLSAGDMVTISYQKDYSVSSNNDTVYFRVSTSDLIMVPSNDIEATCERAVVCDICGEIVKAVSDHTYTNDCDTSCNVCGAVREVGDHVYDNDCDASCNICGQTRTVSDHVYDNDCDASCNVCGAVREVGDHIYDNDCDASCNICGQVRTVGDHVYDNDCDKDCNLCGEERTVGSHKYDDKCDATCNNCGFERKAPHSYTDEKDAYCDLCNALREIKLDGYMFGKTGKCTYELNGTVLTIRGNGAMENYSKDLLAPWGKKITEVIFESGVTAVGNRAFYGCESLKKVTFANTITHIGNNAFFRCKALSELNLPTNLSSVGIYVFKYCTGLTEVEIPASLTTIGTGMFDCCDKIVSVKLPSTLKNIGEYAFTSTSALTDIYFDSDSSYKDVLDIATGNFRIKNKVVWHYNNASEGKTGDCDWFKDGTSLLISGYGNMADYTLTTGTVAPWGTDITDVTVKKGVTSIGNRAFVSCNKLVTATIADTVSSIGNNAFFGCTSLESISLPSELSFIGVYVFKQCSALKSISIPEGVETIGSGMFDSCTSLSEAALPSTLKAVSEYAFYNCTGLTEVWYNGTEAEKNSLSIATGNGKLKNAAWNYGAYSIGSTKDCVWVKKGTTLIISGNGLTENYTANSVSPWGTDLTKVIIEEGVTGIGTRAFYGCTNLTEVVIASTVKSISNHVFYNCSSLETVTLPDTFTTFGTYVFGGCTNLKNVNIPEGVTAIPNGLFENCSSITEITLPRTLESIGNYSFYGTSALTTINFNGNTADKAVITFGSGNTKIKNLEWNILGAMSGTTGDCTWTISGSTLTITGSGEMGKYTVNNPAPWGTNIKTVTIKAGVKSISNRAFYGCDKLTTVNVTSGLTSIGNNAFYGCSALESFNMPVNVTSIGSYAFKYCTSLKEISIPLGVKTIETGTFDGCTSLTTVTLAKTVNKVGDYAFYGTNALTTVNFGGTVAEKQAMTISSKGNTKLTGATWKCQ